MQDNDKNYPEQEYTILERYANDNEHFIVFADILGPSYQAGWKQFSKDGWTIVFSPYGGTRYYKVFKKTNPPDPVEWLNSIESLNKLLLAYFVNDFMPRKIYKFAIPTNLDETTQLNLISVFGAPQLISPRIDERTKIKLHETEKSTISSYMSGTIFNGMREDLNAQIDDELIDKWYQIFSDKALFTSISLLQESFIYINKQFSQWNFFNYIEFSTGIILLVSALENLFTFNETHFADLKFKFKVIGSLYYQKNVTGEFLSKIGGGSPNQKFSQGDFQQILAELYDLRSDIAHGSYKKILKKESWKKLFELIKVGGYDGPGNAALLLKHAALALGLLQKHIFALIIQSNKDLLKGSKIVEEIEIGNSSLSQPKTSSE